MLSKKEHVTEQAEKGWLKAIKCASMEKRTIEKQSMTLRMTDLLPTQGNPLTKCIVMSLQQKTYQMEMLRLDALANHTAADDVVR